jgi:hypothetical protein
MYRDVQHNVAPQADNRGMDDGQGPYFTMTCIKLAYGILLAILGRRTEQIRSVPD